MDGIYFIVSTLAIILVLVLVVRGAAIALMLTGMDERRAYFQALSALTGTGFTTKEAESVVNNPTRRRIISWLMILGYAGVVTIIVTITTSLLTSQGVQLSINILVLMLGIFAIYLVANSEWFKKKWERFVENRIVKHSAFEESTTEDLLHFLEGYGLVRVVIKNGASLAGNPLSECRLKDKGLIVLGIERERDWIPTPRSSETIKTGDRLVVYGPLKSLRDTFSE